MLRLFPSLRICLLFLLSAYLLTNCSAPVETAGEAESQRPNIIYILADDLGYGDVGVYGQQTIQTPNIDLLAREGIRFTQHYAGSTVCAPSRCVLMTGKHTGRAKVRGNARVPLEDSDATLAEVLKQTGYITGMIGKWGLGEAGSTGIPNRQGFDYFYGFLNQTHAHNSYPNYLWENETIDSLDNVVETIQETYAKGIGGIATEKNVFVQDVFMEKARSFLAENRDTSFFLYLPFTAPHANNEARHFDAIGIEVPDLGVYAEKDWPEAQKAHAALITYLDQHVGELMQYLKELGLDENTLVIFSSDNGPHAEGGADPDFFDSNGLLRGLKRDLYEGGIRVPMIARWPGVIGAGQETDHPSAFWDVLPTLCELTGSPVPADIDGISFLPTLMGESQPKHEYLYWEFYEQGGKKAVRWDDWKMIILGVKPEAPADTLLFDLSKDIGEEENIAGQHPDLIEKGLRMMEDAHRPSAFFSF